MASTPPPQPTHILETIIYVRSMSRSVAFYTHILGLEPVEANERIAIFPLGPGFLLLFQLGLTGEDLVDDDGKIPRHGPTEGMLPYLGPSSGSTGTGRDSGEHGAVSSDFGGLAIGTERLRQHFCLAVSSAEDTDAWDAHLQAQGVEILGRVRWPFGRGRSVYFADPDGNVGEVASKGIWHHLMKVGI